MRERRFPKVPKRQAFMLERGKMFGVSVVRAYVDGRWRIAVFLWSAQGCVGVTSTTAIPGNGTEEIWKRSDGA